MSASDVIERAARLLCGGGKPCAKHLKQAQQIWDMYQACSHSGEQPKQELWELAEH